MPAETTAFRVAHDGPLTAYSRRHPNVTLSLWCNWECEVLSAAGATAEQAAELREIVASRSPWMEEHELAHDTRVLVLKCVGLPHDDVNELVDKAHCVNVPPTRFEGGWEHYEVLSFDEERTRWLFQEIRALGRNVELLRKRKVGPQALLKTSSLGVNAVFSGLTERQATAVVLAQQHGFYDSPKRTTAAAIAAARGLSRSTFEEHLRKAENTLLTNLVPYLELWAKSQAQAPAAATAPPTPGAGSAKPPGGAGERSVAPAGGGTE